MLVSDDLKHQITAEYNVANNEIIIQTTASSQAESPNSVVTSDDQQSKQQLHQHLKLDDHDSNFSSKYCHNSSATNAAPNPMSWDEVVHLPVLPVRCKNTSAELHKNRFGSGGRGRCVKLGQYAYSIYTLRKLSMQYFVLCTQTLYGPVW